MTTTHLLRMPDAHISVRVVDPSEHDTITLIAQRMRLTLAEVLGASRARAMYTSAELVDRVMWHLDRSDPERRAEVLVAEDEDAAILGHTMVRIESGDDVQDGPFGLFATMYVTPEARRLGVASALLEHGEAWMREAGMTDSMTFTDSNNARLLALYTRHGYTCEQIDDDWSRAHRAL